MTGANLTLAFDSSAAYCAAALLSGDRVLKSCAEEMTRGQAERLMPLLQELLDDCGADWPDLARIGVGVGPGNFTGIRISVAAARGLALGLGIPALGVTTLDALRGGAAGIAAVPAPRDMVYVQVDDQPPQMIARAELPEATTLPGDPAELAVAIARLAATRPMPDQPPAPFYLRAADAAPSSDPPVVILDDA